MEESAKGVSELTADEIKFVTNNYVVEDVNEKFRGHGVLTFPDGDKYDGKWKNGKADGLGVYTFATGTQYKGQFKNGLAEG